ncbi:hypothetical protein K504DRAFT_454107 [Pleomassaria siparia CBS 279.74]|uniref:F-box domain-containing protein n=1 Tax=Pleomassaria siparia CBS 279.74 TaxID=1314801 RepID=A0A6G1KFB0_9PLEO|nr:hypothetical protein K504DRAFT_454107 [Pleomassaria siparia CBS 279.74]
MLKFSEFPTEMKTHIFSFIRAKVDQKKTGLISREWNDIMSPLMWKELHSNLLTSPRKSLSALLHTSSRALPHIRSLSIDWAHLNKWTIIAAAECNLRLLLCAMPKDKLLHFRSNSPIDASVLQFLLQTHHKLKSINTGLIDRRLKKTDSLVESIWLIPHLSNVTDITVAMRFGQTKGYYSGFRFLVCNIPRLSRFCLLNKRRVCPRVDIIAARILGPTPTVPQARRLSHLTTLDMSAIDLSYPQALIDHLDLPTLENISMLRCNNAESMLQALSTSFSTGPCRLKSVVVDITQNTVKAYGASSAIDGLLASCSGLKRIIVHTTGQLVSKDSIIRHGATLKELSLTKYLYGSFDQYYYSIHDLTAILQSCSVLECLGLSLGSRSFKLGHIRDMGLSFSLPTVPSTGIKSDVLVALDAVATISRLRVLRIMYCASVDFDVNQTVPQDTTHHCTFLMQHLANQILRYLVSRKRSIRKLIVSSPDVGMSGPENPRVDRNGHTWPMYLYSEGRTKDSTGQEEVVAVPIDPTEVNREMLDFSGYFLD